MNKNKLGIILIMVVLVISIYTQVVNRREGVVNREMDRVQDLKSLSSDSDTINTILLLEKEWDSFKYKNVNYPMVKFFKNINNKEFEKIDIYPELVEFLALPDNYFKNSYGDFDNYFYKIMNLKKIEDVYLYEVQYKKEVDGELFFKMFSSNGENIIDMPFIGVESIGQSTKVDKLIINLASRAIFDDSLIYKLELENDSDEFVNIDDGIYGFCGSSREKDERFGHKLVGGTPSDYQLLPREKKNLYVKIPTSEEIDLYVSIDGKEYKIN